MSAGNPASGVLPRITNPCPKVSSGLNRLLDRMVQRLVWAVSPREVILFGSHSKGLANRQSDIDLLVITDGASDAILATAAFDATRGAVKCDVVLRDPAALAVEVKDRYGFLAGVLASGWSLYCRPGVTSLRVATHAADGPAVPEKLPERLPR